MTAPATVRQRTEPLDPDSPRGREVAARLTRTLAVIELELAERRRAAAAAVRTGQAAAVVALVLAVAVLPLRHRATEPVGGPAGSRRDDPRHAKGQWHVDRDDPAEQQGSGRPWAGPRSNVEGGGRG